MSVNLKDVLEKALPPGNEKDWYVAKEDIDPALSQVVTVELSLSSAQILALNTTPVELLPAPGSGKAINILSAVGQMHFLTAAYATHTVLALVYHGQAAGPLQSTTLLPISSGVLIDPLVASGQPQLLSDTGLDVTVLAGDPTAGSGTLKLYVTYEVITL